MENNVNQKVSCVANYTYEASEADELSLRPGDVVRDVERLAGGWWRGELRGRRGMFPDNFVSVVSEHAPNRSSGVQGRCKALFTYNPANPDELHLCVGDTLEVLCEVEEGWWQGRRQGRVGVFPSNFVVMIDGPTANAAPPPYDPAPALPPKPIKEQCRVLFPYTAVNEDELTLNEGEVVTVVSREAPDRGWWRGELNGKVGLFPDNFVQLITTGASEVEEKKPDRPTSKNVYPILNKYSEKTSSIKELTSSKTSLHKENTLNKETNAHKETIITHTNKSESEKVIFNETVNDGTLDGQLKKPPVPIKKSPTPSIGVGGLLSGLKSKMLSNDKDKSTPVSSSTSSSSGEWDKPDGVTSSKTNTFDHVERNSILNDPRAGRVKAPRRRPPSQAVTAREEQQIGLSNGHEAEKPLPDKAEEVKPKAREWEKHRAPWMEELKLNQAKKTTFGEVKSRSVCSSDTPVSSKAGGGSTDRILECGLEEKKSTHSMEMSKSTSSISSRISVLENFEEVKETKVRHSMDSKKEEKSIDNDPPTRHSMHSPTAAGRTFTSMLEDINMVPAPSPPSASVRTHTEKDKSTDIRPMSNISNVPPTDIRPTSNIMPNSSIFEKPSAVSESIMFSEKYVSEEKPVDKASSTLERRSQSIKVFEKTDGTDALINQLNDRILNLEKLLEVQNAKFTAAIEELSIKLVAEVDKRQALQAEVDKLAHCVTQV